MGRSWRPTSGFASLVVFGCASASRGCESSTRVEALKFAKSSLASALRVSVMTDLEFDRPFCQREELVPSDGDWRSFFGGLRRRPAFVSVWSGPRVCGYDGAAVRLGGYFVEPLESVVSLRPYNDVLEGVVELEGVESPVPYSFFEIEKLLRMMLHQSGLALEILASPGWIEPAAGGDPCSEPRSIVERAVTREILGHYHEMAAPLFDGGLDEVDVGGERANDDVCELVRQAGIGAALAGGRVSLDLERLAGVFEIDASGAPGTREWVEEAADAFVASEWVNSTALPSTPADYGGLDAWLVERRMASGRDVREA